MPKAETDIPDEVLDAAELGLGGPKQGLIKLDFIEGQAQEVLNPSLLLCENVTFSPYVLKKLLLFVPSRWWSIGHVIVNL